MFNASNAIAEGLEGPLRRFCAAAKTFLGEVPNANETAQEFAERIAKISRVPQIAAAIEHDGRLQPP